MNEPCGREPRWPRRCLCRRVLVFEHHLREFDESLLQRLLRHPTECVPAFEDALKLDPKHANSHYQLAMCYINLGKMPEAVASFEAYLANAPDGQYAAQVKAMLAQLKK